MNVIRVASVESNAETGKDTSILQAAWGDYEAGRYSQAWEHLGSLLDRADTPWLAWHLGGLVHAALGLHTQAIKYYSRAVHAAPTPGDLARSWGAAGRSHAALGASARARTCLEMALRQDAALGAAWVDLAAVYFSENRLREAWDCLDRADAQRFRSLTYWIVRARLQHRLRDYDKEAECLREALTLEPTSAEAKFGFANLYASQGRLEEATELVVQVIEETPEYPAYELFADLHRFTPKDLWIERLLERMRHFKTQEGDNPELQINLSFACAKALEDSGQDAEAFRLYRRANAMRRSLIRDWTLNDVLARHARLNGFLHRETTLGAARSAAQSLQWPQRPIFIVGLSRTGSSLLEQMLSCHPGIHAVGETGFLRKLTDSLLEDGTGESKPVDGALVSRLREIRETYLRYLTRWGQPTTQTHIVDKSLGNYVLVPLLRALFPEATVIEMRRHPLAIFWACWRQDFAIGVRYSFDPGELLGYIQAYHCLMGQTLYREGMVTCYHEVLLRQPEQALQPILTATNLPFTATMLHYQDSMRVVETASRIQIRQPIDPERAERWRCFLPWLAETAERMEPLIASYEEELSLQVPG